VLILQGDAQQVLRRLSTGSVHCVITSPPYWGGFRDYGVAGQLGHELQPQQYVDRMVQIFREVRRVLRDDGTLWLVLGDTYVTNGPRYTGRKDGARRNHWGRFGPGEWRVTDAGGQRTKIRVDAGLPHKSLVAIPWRVALALQADGWILRSDIIWAKRNPMPESVVDRPTRAHEYMFLFAKSDQYYFDAAAIKEPRAAGNGFRHRRSVWTVAVQPFCGAHFATFPPALIEPCILAGTSPAGCCPICGAPWTTALKNGNGRSDQGPTCNCGIEGMVPCTVLDPFGGAGTTGLVAAKHGRKAVLIELNPEYCNLARERLNAHGHITNWPQLSHAVAVEPAQCAPGSSQP